MKTPLRVVCLVVVGAVATLAAPNQSLAQWRYGGSTEFSVPLGDLNTISLMGLSAIVYGGREIERGKWALQLDSGIQWFIPEEIAAADVPEWVPNPKPDSRNLVRISGSFIPIRGSLTRFFRRYYVSPKVGVYIPAGGFRNDVEMSTMFGVAPRLGYLFQISSELQFDFAFEYNYLFGDLSTHYAGVSMGLFFGGRRLRR